MSRRIVLSLTIAVAACAIAGAATAAGAKPTIGAPVAARQAVAGTRFTVQFHVAHASSVAFLDTLGRLRLRHSDSFHSGIARTTMTLPASAKGLVHVKLTARGAGASAAKAVSFPVTAAAVPELTVGDAQAPEGDSGTSQLSFEVDLDPASSKQVTVHYATVGDSATAGSDFTGTSGTLTFAPGQTTKTITVSVVGDKNIEADEVFNVTLSNAVNADIAADTGEGTIQNDDQPTLGNWQGATQSGDYIYFTVTPDQKMTDIRANSLSMECADGSEFRVTPNWGSSFWLRIFPDGSYDYQGTWTGSETYGDYTFTSETDTFKGQFATDTAMSGSLGVMDQFTYKGTPYTCSTTVTMSATFQG